MSLFSGSAWSRFIAKEEVREEIEGRYPDEEVFIAFFDRVENATTLALGTSRVEFSDMVHDMHTIAKRFGDRHISLTFDDKAAARGVLKRTPGIASIRRWILAR